MGARYICRACGLIYDEALGDADSGLAPGTRFADIPDDWACPLCGVTKADFEPYELIDSAAAARAASTLARPGRRVSARQHAGTVIVGAGHAGWTMAEALRAHDPELPITVVTACDGSVYDKPMISVALARGLAPESMHRESGPSAAARLGVTLLTRTHAIGITQSSRQLRTSRGTLRYRDLVLAHGAQSRLPAPLSAAHCWRINHLSAYVGFRAAVGTTPQRIAVIGAGLIGCELANDLALAGHRVTLFDLATRPLAACLDEAQSRQLLQAWSGLALDFVGGVCVQAVERTGRGADARETQITLTDGRLYDVDQVVAAVGLATPGRLAASAGLAFDNGIVVEQGSLATSVPHIHAIGDCISIAGKASRYIEPIGRQARLVAARIAGVSSAPYAGSPVPVRIKTTSLPFTVAGS